MNDERPSINDIVAHWEAKVGEAKVSERGVEYKIIPSKTRPTEFNRLIRAILNNGYELQDIRSISLRTKIVHICWSNRVKKLSNKQLKEARDEAAEDWDKAVAWFFKIDIPDAEEIKIATNNTQKPKKEFVMGNPEDMIKMDTSDMESAPFDEELIAELAKIGTIIDRGSNE